MKLYTQFARWLLLPLCGAILAASAGLVRADVLPNLAGLGVPEDLSGAMDRVRQAADQHPDLASWSAAADAIGERLGRLYGNEGAEASAHRELLTQLRDDAKTIEAALKVPENLPIADPLTAVGNRLRRRVEILSAALALVDPASRTDDAGLQRDRQAIAQSIRKLSQYLSGHAHQDAWTKYLRLPPIQTALEGDAPLPLEAVEAAAARFDSHGLSATYQEVLRRPAFAGVRGALVRYVEQRKAWDQEVSDSLKQQAGELIAQIELYERSGSGQSVPQIRALTAQFAESNHPLARRLAEQVHTYYFDDNIRVVVSEELFRKTIETTQVDSGPVRDFILGADVFGDQVTRSHVDVQLEPSREAASYSVLVTGQTNSETEGYRESAVVYTHTTSDYVARRRFYVSPEGMSASKVSLSVHSNSNTLGADTNYGWLPLLGGMARGIAVQKAEQQRPEAEAIAESRVRERVVPRITREGNQRITRFNQWYRDDVRGPLSAQGLFPDPLRFSSTSSHLFANGRLANADELGGHRPNLWIPQGSLGVLQLHQSALNNLANRFEIAGKTFDRAGFAQLLQERLGKVLPAEFPEITAEPGAQAGSITFAEQDPIRIRFEDGALRVTLRAASFKSPVLNVPGQIISVRYRPELDGKTVHYARDGGIDVRPLKEPKTDQERAQALGYAIALRTALTSTFRPTYETPAAFTFTDRLGRQHTLHVVGLKLLDGWLSLALR